MPASSNTSGLTTPSNTTPNNSNLTPEEIAANQRLAVAGAQDKRFSAQRNFVQNDVLHGTAPVYGATVDMAGNPISGAAPVTAATGTPEIDRANFTDGYAQTEKDANNQYLAYMLQRRAMSLAPTTFAPQQTAAGTTALNTLLSPTTNAASAQLQVPDQFRNSQTGLINQLTTAANGQGPSVAEMQLKDATDRNIAQQTAALTSARGGMNPALAARILAQTGTTANQQAGDQAAQMRVQEQQAAQQALGNLTTGARGQDITQATTQAGYNEQTGLANASADNARNAAMAQLFQNNNQFNATQGQANNEFNATQGNAYNQSLNTLNQGAATTNLQAQMAAQQQQDALFQYLNNSNININNNQESSNEAYNTLKANYDIGQATIQQKRDAQDDANVLGGVSAGLGALGTAASIFSDENVKKNIDDGSDSLLKFFNPANYSSSSSSVQPDLVPSRNVQKIKYQAPATDNSGPVTGNWGEKLAAQMASIGKDIRDGVANGNTYDPSIITPTPDATVTPRAPMMTDISSDENSKKNITDGDSKERQFLDALNAHEYEYKDPDQPGAAPGKFVSPMAQELEKSELGRSMVTDTPQGKMVDYSRGFGAMLASQAMNNKRINQMEEDMKRILSKGGR